MKFTMVLFLFSSLLISGLALAENVTGELQAVPADPVLHSTASLPDCQVGNYDFTGIFYWVGGNNLWGNESYKLIIGPEDQCPNCPLGFTVQNIYMVLYFSDEDVPATFTVSADIEEAVWDGECWSPGSQVALSESVVFTINTAGIHTIAIPIDVPCLGSGFNYGIGVHFETPFPENMRPEWTFDMTEFTSCNSWGLWEGASDWVRILEIAGYSTGDLLIWADAVCCENPVEVDQKTFGDVKSLYR